MKERKIRFALRAHRRSVGLSQREVAMLLGLASGAHVSSIEQGRRDPSFAIAFAWSALFGVSLCELFPHTAIEVKDGLKRRAGALCEQVRCSDRWCDAHKARFLGTVPSTAFDAIMRHYHA